MTSIPTTPSGPGEKKPPRIAGYDVARAVAICLMILENFKVYLHDGHQGSPILIWLAGLTDGRSAPLFVMLAGVGVTLISKAAREADDAEALAGVQRVLWRRALFFLVAGNLFILAWSIDILHFYAIYVAIGALLLPGSTRRRLLGAAAVLLAASSAALYSRGEAFFEHFEYYSPEGILRDTLLDGVHPVFPWVVFVVVGMWLGRLELSDRTLRWRVIWVSAAVLVGAELLSDWLISLNIVQGLPTVPTDFPQLMGTSLTPPGPLYVIAASAMSILFVCLCHIVAERWPEGWPVRALTAAGQLSLTLYIAHALVGVGLICLVRHMEDPTVGYVDFMRDRSIEFVLAYWAAYTSLSIAAATWYRQHSKLGPLEWVMRRLSGSPPRPAQRARSASGERGTGEGPTVSDPVWLRLVQLSVAIGTFWLAYSVILGARPGWGCPPERPTLRAGQPLVSSLSIDCQERWFELEVPEEREGRSTRLSVRSGADTYLEVWDEGGQALIDEDDDSGFGYCPQLSSGLTAGRYLVKVRPYSSGSGPFSVELLAEAAER